VREVSRNGVDEKDGFVFPSYVEDILGPEFFDYGYGPFRWVCLSGSPEDLHRSREARPRPRQLGLDTAPRGATVDFIEVQPLVASAEPTRYSIEIRIGVFSMINKNDTDQELFRKAAAILLAVQNESGVAG